MSKDWISPLKIPEGKVGKAFVEHQFIPPGEKIMIANMRVMYLGGYRKKPPAMNVVYSHPTLWHWLKHDDFGVWTSDLPCEQFQQLDATYGLHGSILIGGLGLGMIHTLLAKKQNVQKITVIENDKDVIKLVGPHVKHRKVEIIHEDLFVYLQLSRRQFDGAFFDIWQSDGELSLTRTVYPLRHIARSSVKGGDKNIRCWNESLMKAQVRSFLTSRINALGRPEAEFLLWPKKKEETCNHYWPYFNYINQHQIENIHQRTALADVYCDSFGTAAWEKLFGVKHPKEVQFSS